MSLMRLAPVGIALVRNRQVVMANECMCRLYGRSEKEMHGMNIRESYVNQEDFGTIASLMTEALKTGSHVSHETRIRRPDNSQIDVMLRLAPLSTTAGTNTWVALAIDISAQKQAEALRLAKTKADSANHAKSTFLANMSHEIRTPMNAILGFTQLLLKDESLPPRQRDYLSVVDSSGEHLLGLINDVLEISKIEANKVSLNKCAFSPVAMISETCSMFSSRAKEKQLGMEIQGLDSLPREATGDKGKLRQVLTNILGNAIKFTGAGRVHIEASARPAMQGEFSLRIDVSDTGPGIHPDEQPVLFTNFEQTSVGRLAGGGTGLGLAISRRYARLMGGDVSLLHTSPAGSCFRIEVKMEPAPARAALEADSNVGKVLQFHIPFAPFRVLMVDDESGNLHLLEQILGEPGIELHSCSRAEEALRLCQSLQPHCVLMDLRMPGMDGLEAIRRIRALKECARTRILVLSASALDDTRSAVLAHGADEFLGKPFRIDALLTLLQRLFPAPDLNSGEGSLPSRLQAPTLGNRLSLRDALARAPASLRDPLRTALLRADQEQCLELLTPLREIEKDAYATLSDALLRYDYSAILNSLESSSSSA